MGPRLHGMARRTEQIELNRSSCAHAYARVLGAPVHGATAQLTLTAEGSSPSPPSPLDFDYGIFPILKRVAINTTLDGGTEGRISLPPVESPCLAGFRPLTSKSRAFPAGVRGGGVIAYSARGSFRSTDINLTMRV
jgi:hypothetical protein